MEKVKKRKGFEALSCLLSLLYIRKQTECANALIPAHNKNHNGMKTH